MQELTQTEKELYRSLSSPTKIQNYLNTLAMRTDEKEPIVRSPRKIIESMSATCMEGALLAAVALSYHGHKPLLMDLKVGRNTRDVDHVVALFKEDGSWGALSKTNHGVLRYREPIYKNVRELALSYFHEYFTNDGKKNLRSYSEPFDISKKFGMDWITSDEDLYEMAYALDEIEHTDILTPKMARNLRLADDIEIEAGKIKED